MGKPKKSESEEEITFEEAIQNLEQIVKDMESERMPLDQLVQRYEKGSRLLQTCEQRIREAEQRIELIAAGETGVELTPFDAEPKEAPAAKGGSSRKRKEPASEPAEAGSDPAADEAGSAEEAGAESEDEEIQLF